MTEKQKEALAIFSDKNIGAIYSNGEWIWPEDVREDENNAVKVLIKKGKLK
jgi:hypothetical protein